tara:strand:- start:1197 stop:1412 length:216 start_codon:yes stop_codon:yes gene_type:complete
MKRTYKNRAMRAETEEKPVKNTGTHKDKIKIYLGPIHREKAKQIADRLNLSIEDLLERYITQMLADNIWPR